MHKELRYQAKIQAISDMPRKEKYNFMQFLPQQFFFFFFKYALWKEHHKVSMQGKIKPVKDCQNRKTVPDLLLLSSPDSTCNILSREIGAKE
jgi:hypothetical protein